ncbi:MAG: hypothetical protein WCP07_10035, partial [bacterium]
IIYPAPIPVAPYCYERESRTHSGKYHASMGWERFVDDLEVIVTPGTHHTMLDEPCIHRTLEQVRHVLKRSET